MINFIWAVRDRDLPYYLEPIPFEAADKDAMKIALSGNPKQGTKAKKASSSSLAQVSVFVTKDNGRQPQDVEEALPYVYHNGRPDVDAMFQETMKAALALGENRVAVVACGPEKLVHSLLTACAKYSGKDSGVVFDLHTEPFEF